MARPHRFRTSNLKPTTGFANNKPSKPRSFVPHPAVVPLIHRLIIPTASATSKRNSDPPSSNMAKCKPGEPFKLLNPGLPHTDRPPPLCSISTAQKMIRACNTLSIPIYATTQSASRLGPSQSTPQPFPTTDPLARSHDVQSAPNSIARPSTQSTRPPSRCSSPNYATRSPNAPRYRTRSPL